MASLHNLVLVNLHFIHTFLSFLQAPPIPFHSVVSFPRFLVILASRLYPTPCFPPVRVFCWPSSFLLNHASIFGWFFVRFSPFLRSMSSCSFFFSFSAALSFLNLAFNSLFVLCSSFLASCCHTVGLDLVAFLLEVLPPLAVAKWGNFLSVAGCPLAGVPLRFCRSFF